MIDHQIENELGADGQPVIEFLRRVAVSFLPSVVSITVARRELFPQRVIIKHHNDQPLPRRLHPSRESRL
jgi:hypothetical protein